jgi:hypothetical protein
MNKILSLLDAFRTQPQRGEAIDLTYGKLRIKSTTGQRDSFDFNETSVAVHRAIYKSLGLSPKV